MNNDPYAFDHEFWDLYADTYARTSRDNVFRSEFDPEYAAPAARSEFATDDMIVLHEIRPGSEVAVR